MSASDWEVELNEVTFAALVNVEAPAVIGSGRFAFRAYQYPPNA
jgi:hypothetical protein